MENAKINQLVPNFEFEVYHDNQFKKTKIADFSGKWLILFFYPADFTFICPTELRELAQHYEAIQAEGAEIVSISTDTTFVHKAWHDSSEAIKGIKFPMAADPTGTLSRYFNTYIENEGLALRGTFIIDPDGQVKTMEIHDNSIGRSAAETLRKLQAAKFVREHGGEVCPANWQKGAATLKPGIDLVGKI